MDQIHEYAAHQHREFVIEHLEPWLLHAEECSVKRLREIYRVHPEEIPEPPTPEWFKIKHASRQAEKVKGPKTRNRSKSETMESTSYDISRRPVQTFKVMGPPKVLDAAEVQMQRNRACPRNKITKRQSKKRCRQPGKGKQKAGL